MIILAAVMLVAAFGLTLHLIENHGLKDEQFGDTGGWGDEEPYEQYFTIGDDTYVTKDNLATYLFIGTDAGGEDLGEAYQGELADFLLLLVVDNTTQKYAFMQIDRNTMTDVQVLDDKGEFNSLENMQVCISHWYGLTPEERNDNTAQAVATIMGDMDIGSYYTVNMADIGAINNAIGGVDVEIQEDLTSIDPAFKEGATVHLTDEQAEKFVRARMDAGDGSNRSRMARQTQYLHKAYSMMMDALRDNPEYVNDLYMELEGKIQSGGEKGDLSELTNKLVMYENCGILQFDGESKTGVAEYDGLEHEEFYMDPASLLENLKKVITLEKYEE